jgi:hypothetical protein
VDEDEFRVEVDLDDDRHGYSLGERLRALDLDEEARARLGEGVIVTRDGARLFAYAGSERQAREAERVVRRLLAEDRLTADVSVTRWHPVEETWKDAFLPLPETDEERRVEYARKEAVEEREADSEGEFDWTVYVALATRDDASELARSLEQEGLAVARRWKYVAVGAITEERARELEERLRGEVPPGADVWIGATGVEVRTPLFLLLIP